jgi:hypothetical protein
MAEGVGFVPKNTVFHVDNNAKSTLFKYCLALFVRRFLMSLLTLLLTVDLHILARQRSHVCTRLLF